MSVNQNRILTGILVFVVTTGLILSPSSLFSVSAQETEMIISEEYSEAEGTGLPENDEVPEELQESFNDEENPNPEETTESETTSFSEESEVSSSSEKETALDIMISPDETETSGEDSIPSETADTEPVTDMIEGETVYDDTSAAEEECTEEIMTETEQDSEEASETVSESDSEEEAVSETPESEDAGDQTAVSGAFTDEETEADELFEVIEEEMELQDLFVPEEPSSEEEEETSEEKETNEETEEETVQEKPLLAVNSDMEHSIPLTFQETYEVTVTSAWEMLYYSFTPETSGAYCFSSQGTGNAIAYLYNSNQYNLKADAPSGKPANFSISYYLESGKTYYLKVSSRYAGTAFTFSVEQAAVSGTTGTGAAWNYDDSTDTLTITGSGEIPDYASENDAPWNYFNTTAAAIVISEGITRIGAYAFSEFRFAETVSIPSTVVSIGDYAFYSCDELTVLRLPEGLTTIGASAFAYLTSVNTLEIPSTVVSIGSYAFSRCHYLRTLYLHKETASIGYGAFNGLSYLKTLYFYGTEEEFAQLEIGDYNEDLLEVYKICLNDGGSFGESLSWTVSSDGTLTISGTGNMPSFASASSVPWSAEKNGIRTVVVEQGITDISDYAFSGCSELQEVFLPVSLVSVGNAAFENCSSLQNVYYTGDQYDWENVTAGTSNDNLNQAAFTYLYGYGLENAHRWILDRNGLLTVTGTGEIPQNGSVHWNNLHYYIQKVVIQEGITAIGQDAFAYCIDMYSLTLPESLESIGNYAFYECQNCERITVPANVTRIGTEAFYNCRELFFYGSAPEGTDLTELLNAVIYYPAADQSWTSLIELSDSSNTWIPWYSPADLEEFKLSGNSTMILGQQQQLSVGDFVVPGLSWSSSDSTVACVDEDGTVAALGPGEAVITVSYGGGAYQAEFSVTVTDINTPEVSNISVDGTGSSNVSMQNYAVWSQTVTSYLYENEDRTFTRVEGAGNGNVVVEIWTSGGEVLNTQTILAEMPVFGGFFNGADFNFLIYGQENPEESEETEVLRVVKYSKNWERIDAASVYGANTVFPFDAGLRCTETDGKLYVHTSHLMYLSDDGYHHQANMTCVFSQDEMKLIDSYYDVMNLSYGYVSHSFNQFIRTDGNYVYRVDHGDAYPRGIAVTRCHSYELITDVDAMVALYLPGTQGANATGMSLGGFEISADGLLIAGNCVDLDDYDVNAQRNIFLNIADQELTESRMVWITDYPADTTISVGTPHLVKINDYVFLMMWEEYDSSDNSNVVRLCRVDQNGNILSEIAETNLQLSDCQPILTDEGLVSWYVTEGIGILYQINPFALDQINTADSGIITSGTYNGIWWSLDKDGVLTMGGYGNLETWMIDTDFSQVNKLVILDGISSIDEYSLSYMNNMKSVFIPESITSISDHVFDYCHSFSDLYYAGTQSEWNKVSFNQETNEKIDSVNLHFKADSEEKITLSESSFETTTMDYRDLQAVVLAQDVPGSELVWSSSNPDVASVDEYGYVSLNTYGTAVITAALKNNPSVMAQCTVQTRYYDVCGSNVSGASDYEYWWNAVYWAADNAITKGYGNVYFGPEWECTRRELAIFLWRMGGAQTSSSYTVPFADVTKKYKSTTDTWKAIAWCYANGIIRGFDDGTFRPDDNVNRKDTMIMLYRFAGKPKYRETRGTMKFDDVVGIYSKSSDTYNAINWAYQTRITNGYSSYYYGCWNSILRKDIVTFLYRYAGQ